MARDSQDLRQVDGGIANLNGNLASGSSRVDLQPLMIATYKECLGGNMEPVSAGLMARMVAKLMGMLKAIVALIVPLLVPMIADLLTDLSNEVMLTIGAGATALVVWAVPNKQP